MKKLSYAGHIPGQMYHSANTQLRATLADWIQLQVNDQGE